MIYICCFSLIGHGLAVTDILCVIILLSTNIKSKLHALGGSERERGRGREGERGREGGGVTKLWFACVC